WTRTPPVASASSTRAGRDIPAAHASRAGSPSTGDPTGSTDSSPARWAALAASDRGDHVPRCDCQPQLGGGPDEPVVGLGPRLALGLEDFGPAVEQADRPEAGRVAL